MPDWILYVIGGIALLLIILGWLDWHYGWPLSWLKTTPASDPWTEQPRKPLAFDEVWPLGEPDWRGFHPDFREPEEEKRQIVVGPGRGREVDLADS